IIAQLYRPLQRSLDPNELHLTGRDLASRLIVIPCGSQAALVAAQHATKNRDSTLFRLSVGTTETDQSLRTMFSGGQSTEVGTHVPQVAAGRERSPFLCGRILQSFLTVMSLVKTADCLAILLDKLARVEFGVDHYRV